MKTIFFILLRIIFYLIVIHGIHKSIIWALGIGSREEPEKERRESRDKNNDVKVLYKSNKIGCC